MKRKWIFAIVLSLLFACAGCAAEQQKTPADGAGVDPVLLRAGEAASAEIARSVDDLIDNPWHNAILLVEFVNPGEYTRVESSQTFVSPGLEDITITSCGAEALATVLEVYKGDSALVGQTITVGEALNQQEDGTFASGRLGSAELRRAIVFANKQDANYQFVCSTPEHELMPVGEDGTVTVWPWLEGAETLENMQGFSAYCQQRLNAAVVQSAGQPDREEPTRPLNAEELAALETALNRPLNNYLVRSDYFTNTVIDRNEALAGGAGRAVAEATAEELEAYAAQTGERPDALLRMDCETFDWFQSWNLGLGDHELATHWTYLEQFDAWYSMDTECPLRTIQCISGEELINTGWIPSFYRVCYRFTDEDGAACIGTVKVGPSNLEGQMERPMADWEFRAISNTWTQEESGQE